MTAPRKAPLTLSDERMDAIIGMLLRTGVLLASAVVLVGGVLYLLHNGGVRPSYRIFKGEPAQLRQRQLECRMRPLDLDPLRPRRGADGGDDSGQAEENHGQAAENC